MVTSVKERPAYTGSIGMMWGLETILGLVVGGALSDSAS
ncbi:uncharacterized protein VDAG_04867 [Verticillium dahliae VdLs.17]|uniref:Uncharacterized protein n=1 Tax=Verticillium dahliae (strain VdLs.17 / ATCC MYA-4575 / FGSC 10137) TaxID=498257 RepID=G2X382_VERDV|nr:uncharacterized protein VDAG_04867 [Verticillium dahliae VdLs.17]EGY23429.1 hypothetical protein VDAG_04867 [Verticillium dahliae VdLs.17]